MGVYFRFANSDACPGRKLGSAVASWVWFEANARVFPVFPMIPENRGSGLPPKIENGLEPVTAPKVGTNADAGRRRITEGSSEGSTENRETHSRPLIRDETSTNTLHVTWNLGLPLGVPSFHRHPQDAGFRLRRPQDGVNPVFADSLRRRRRGGGRASFGNSPERPQKFRR